MKNNKNYIKKHNNISSRDFLIIFKTNGHITNKIKNQIIRRLSNKLFNFLNISKEKNINFIYELIESYNEELDETIYNEIKILIHFNKPDYLYTLDDDSLICTAEYPEYNLIDSDILLNNIINEDNDYCNKFINRIGVSGISETLMKDLWWNMIRGENGYKKYISYQITKNGIYNDSEKSHDFGWKDYPPVK